MNIIAFDLGGSGGKLFLGSYDKGRLSFQLLHRFEHSAIEIKGHLYWNLLQIYHELCTGITKAVNITSDDICSLGIDSFCNDYALVSHDGELLSQMHSYRDKRTLQFRSRLYDIVSPEQLYHINGNQNAPFNTLMQLGAMMLNGQGTFLSGNKLLFLPDLLIYFLSGKAMTEYTLASVSQMFDYSTQNWSNDILEKYNIPGSLFASIVMPGTINCCTSGESNQLFHSKGFDITTVCEHDTASAFLASVQQKDCAIISCGTWALIGTETAAPVITDYGYRYNIANEGGYTGHHRILKNVMGTWLIQELRADYQTHGQSYTYAEMEQAAFSENAFQYFIDVDDEIFYTPGDMIGKITAYCKRHYGSFPDTLGKLVRCVYESLAMKYRWNLEKLHCLTKKTFKTINILGGGSKSSLMCQFTSNVTGLPVTAGPVEATALGNMIVQLTAQKQISGIEEGRRLIKDSCETFEYIPQDIETWSIKYQKFKNMYNLN